MQGEEILAHLESVPIGSAEKAANLLGLTRRLYFGCY